METSLESEGRLRYWRDSIASIDVHHLEGELGGDLVVLGALHREQVKTIAVHLKIGDQGHHIEGYRHWLPVK